MKALANDDELDPNSLTDKQIGNYPIPESHKISLRRLKKL